MTPNWIEPGFQEEGRVRETLCRKQGEREAEREQSCIEPATLGGMPFQAGRAPPMWFERERGSGCSVRSSNTSWSVNKDWLISDVVQYKIN
ncbi:hypothetical protein PVAP13_8NG085805 [Panicum virgatum]|uniref:Uncharacterized protein n=1 Tax=Panicum virgatum TaxID=38727 RepID=A0A8T0P9U9_PANVG|nr:hypothetical protein PVAP13_8NG085805 [Panicum virgatum]